MGTNIHPGNESVCSTQITEPQTTSTYVYIFWFNTFSVSAPHIWNSLPINITKSQSVSTFRRHLKTHFFQSAFSNL